MSQVQEESRLYREGVRKRATALVRALVRSGFFGNELPPLQELIAQTRIPGVAMEEALRHSEKDGLLKSHGDAWKAIPPKEDCPQVAFLINNSLIANCYGVIQDYFIGFEEKMNDAGYQTLLRADFQNFGAKLGVVKRLHQDGVKGIACAGFTEPRIRQWVLENHFPSVIIGNATIHQQDIGRVSADNVGGIEQMVRHLISQGHRDIGYYSIGLDSHHGFQERAYGYTSTMEEAGLTPNVELMFKELHDADSARRAAMIFYGMPIRPTAILCASDREAFELITELRALEIAVPKEVSIAGFDNNLYGLITDPPLTSIEIYSERMGQVAATYLLSEMETPQMPVNMVLPTKLVVRQSIVPRGIAVANVLAERAKKTDKIRTLQGR